MWGIGATSKVNSLGFPLITLVTQDCDHEIFPIAFAPSSSECEVTISFVLISVAEAYKLLYGKELKISYFMSDCASYTFNSVVKIFRILPENHLSCYIHVKQRQKQKSLAEYKVDKDDRESILQAH